MCPSNRSGDGDILQSNMVENGWRLIRPIRRCSWRFAPLRLLHHPSEGENLFSPRLGLMKVYVFLRKPEKNCGSHSLDASLNAALGNHSDRRETTPTNTAGSRGQCPLVGVQGVKPPGYSAIFKAISIIWVKVLRTSSGVQPSPVKGLSEIVRSASAFLPARAAFRYRA